MYDASEKLDCCSWNSIDWTDREFGHWKAHNEPSAIRSSVSHAASIDPNIAPPADA
jgi:hypothetical protein